MIQRDALSVGRPVVYGGSLPTNYRYTDQELDIATAPTSGLPMYYDARFYDRTSGQFISPDTLIPDPTLVWDYNTLRLRAWQSAEV